MNLRLKSRKIIKTVFILVGSLLAAVITFWSIEGTVWPQWNFQILDIYYKQAIQHSRGVPLSSQIVYVTITDASYAYFGKNYLDRAEMARLSDALATFGAAAVAYDIIFARPSAPRTDQQFAASVARLGSAYLPLGLAYTDQARSFKWEEGAAYERLRADYLKKPVEQGPARPLYATQALMQLDEFARMAFNAGHISISSDPDGVYRHVPMLLKIDGAYCPTLALAMFLDYVNVPLEHIRVHWGHRIVIPAQQGSLLDRDVVIPIDSHGRAFIPYAQSWDHDFAKLTAHALLQQRDDQDLQGNLTEFFEGKFVFISDISVGISDIGHTPLEAGAPLVAVHAALLNGLLSNTFYSPWSFWHVLGLICVLSGLLGLAALLRSSWPLYITGGMVLIGLVGLTWVELTRFVLFPVVTVGGSVFVVFFGLVIGLQIAVFKDQVFIRTAFSKYVPEEVVNELLSHPEHLQLGGEERVLSVLFSDLESFTTIAENMTPVALVDLLNEYLTEMTAIIFAHGGIIDKYEGDAIMAEFGAPLALPNHAELAVRTALAMQRRLEELRTVWEKRGLPALRCRMGINTGPMVVGNMGSNQVFDYTVLGDAVNLASRLESANKFYCTYVMISEDTHTHLPPETFRTRVLDVIKVKGKSRAVKVFEVYGESWEPIDARDVQYYQLYHEAFAAYLSRDFPVARAHFATALAIRPHDPAAQAMLARIDTLDPDRLPADWDGSVALTSK
jgi:adenylate cyclase